MTGLRERKKLDTRRALSDAALALAFERGLDNITRDEIAARAGVSLRTFNNYFTNKYEAVAYRQVQRMRRALDAFRQRPGGEPLWPAVTGSIIETMQLEIPGDTVPTEPQRAEIRKLLLTPETRAALSKDLVEDWVDAVAARIGADAGDMYPRLVVGAVRAVGEAAMDAYTHSGAASPYPELLRQGFALLAAGLAEGDADV